MSERLMTCDEVVALLMPYLDRELTDEETVQVREHLEACSHCASLFVFEESVLTLVKEKLNEGKMPADLQSRIFTSLNEA